MIRNVHLRYVDDDRISLTCRYNVRGSFQRIGGQLGSEKNLFTNMTTTEPKSESNQYSAGREWMKKAQDRLNSFAWFNRKGKYEDAAEMFVKAANIFKMDKKFEEAAEAYNRAAQCYIEIDSKFEAATHYVNASNCLRKTKVSEAATMLQKAISIYTDDGRFSTAAKYEKDLAEMFEAEGDLENAIKHFQKAADYYEGEGSQTTGNSCLLRIAHLLATLEKYQKAVEIFEQVAQVSANNKLTAWSVREYLFKACLLQLAMGDVVSAKRSLERYPEISVQFADSREAKFLAEIIKACENYDVEAFTNATVEYDSISRLDPWHTSILLKIKQSIKVESNDLT